MHSECSESFLASPQYLGICKVRHLSRSGGFTGRGVQRDLRRPNHEDEEAGWVLAGWTVETVLRAGESGGEFTSVKDARRDQIRQMRRLGKRGPSD
jgi:hypothetical protein